MKFSSERIMEVAEEITVTSNLPRETMYDWIDIVGIPQKPANLEDVLLFACHSTGEGGWDNGYDRREYAEKVAMEKGWHLASDVTYVPEIVPHIQVESLTVLSRRIYEAARQENNPFVIGVTGSVGKTTTVSFIEHLISTAGLGVCRFYSKRLTPLSVACHFINRLDSSIPFIVMEYSAYMHSHVAELAKLLPPNIAFLMNVYETHINPGMFSDTQDIFDSKSQIKSKGGDAFVNTEVLQKLDIACPQGWSNFGIHIPDFHSNPILPPTARTAEMYSVGRKVAQEIGLSTTILDQAYSSFTPQEGRILLCTYKGKNIFFHGETSGGSRLWSWFETIDGTVPWMLIEEINFADEDPRGFVNILDKILHSDRTYVLDTPINRARLLDRPAHFVDRETFYEILTKKAEGYIVYHKALAIRHEGFDPTSYLAKTW